MAVLFHQHFGAVGGADGVDDLDGAGVVDAQDVLVEQADSHGCGSGAGEADVGVAIGAGECAKVGDATGLGGGALIDGVERGEGAAVEIVDAGGIGIGSQCDRAGAGVCAAGLGDEVGAKRRRRVERDIDTEASTDGDVDAEFFLEFTGKRGLVGFACRDLAADPSARLVVVKVRVTRSPRAPTSATCLRYSAGPTELRTRA